MRKRIDALAALLVPHAVDRPRPGLVQDPSEDRAVRGIVLRGTSPDVVKDVDGQFLGGLAVLGDAHGQGEDDPVGALKEGAKRCLVARGDGPDDVDPLLLGYPGAAERSANSRSPRVLGDSSPAPAILAIDVPVLSRFLVMGP